MLNETSHRGRHPRMTVLVGKEAREGLNPGPLLFVSIAEEV